MQLSVVPAKCPPPPGSASPRRRKSGGLLNGRQNKTPRTCAKQDHTRHSAPAGCSDLFGISDDAPRRQPFRPAIPASRVELARRLQCGEFQQPIMGRTCSGLPWPPRSGVGPTDLDASSRKCARRLRRRGCSGGPTPRNREAKLSPFQLDKPLPSAQIQGSIKTMQASVPKGYVVEKAGQVRIGSLMWMWHESSIPTFAPATSTQYQEMLRSAPFGSARTWVFTTTPHSQLLRVYCAVLFPRGASAEEMNDRVRQAGDLFAGVLQRIGFSAR